MCAWMLEGRRVPVCVRAPAGAWPLQSHSKQLRPMHTEHMCVGVADTYMLHALWHLIPLWVVGAWTTPTRMLIPATSVAASSASAGFCRDPPPLAPPPLSRPSWQSHTTMGPKASLLWKGAPLLTALMPAPSSSLPW